MYCTTVCRRSAKICEVRILKTFLFCTGLIWLVINLAWRLMMTTKVLELVVHKCALSPSFEGSNVDIISSFPLIALPDYPSPLPEQIHRGFVDLCSP